MGWRSALAALLLVLISSLTVQADTRQPVSITAVGDLMLAFGKPPTPGFPFKHIRQVLQETDLRIANLECAVSNVGQPTLSKSEANIRAGREFVFRADPDVLDAIRYAKFDAVTVANNHSMDYTETAFSDMLQRLGQKGIAVCGGGNDARAAREPALPGRGVAVLGYSDVVPADYGARTKKAGISEAPLEAELMESEAKRSAGVPSDLAIDHDIARARKHAEYVVCFFHWGVECTGYPTRFQQVLAHRCIDAGADLVVGCHPHVLQGMEVYKGHVIAYSMGNFAFYGAHDACCRTGLFGFRLGSGHAQAWFIPVVIDQNEPRLAHRDEAASIANEMMAISRPFGTQWAWHTEKGVRRLLVIAQPSR